MKISFILPGGKGSGGIKVAYKYGELLADLGHEVIFYVPIVAPNLHRKNRLIIDKAKQFKGTIYRFVKYYLMKEDLGSKQVKLIFNVSNRSIDDSDYVIATAWPTVWDVEKLSKSKGKKVYFVQDYEIWDNYNLGKQSYSKIEDKIVIASWINEKIKNDCNAKPGLVVNNGLDIDVYKNNNKKFYDGQREVICLMLYHELEKKGVVDGIEAFKLAKKRHSNIRLKMFGLKKPSNFNYDAEFYENPSISELVRLYSEADIFIFPSREEGWGLTVTEAMACKCAVVGTNVGCMLDIGKNRVTALISETRNPKKMSDNICELIENPNLLKEISVNGCNIVSKLDWYSSAKRFEDALKSFN